MWNKLRFIRFLQVSQIFQRRKSDANKQDFENKFNLTCHAQSPLKTTGILTKVFSTSGPNLVALAWTGDELSRGQAQNGVNFDFEVKFDLEGQAQSPPKTIGILTKVFYIYSPNLVILADMGHELSRGQARDWRTDGHTHRQTDAGNDNTRRPILASGKKRESSLSGHWMGHLLSYSLSGGHDGAMPPINPRGLNWPLTSHFIFSSHMYFSLNTPTHYWSPMPN